MEDVTIPGRGSRRSGLEYTVLRDAAPHVRSGCPASRRRIRPTPEPVIGVPSMVVRAGGPPSEIGTGGETNREILL